MIDHKRIIECAKLSKVICWDVEYQASDYGYHVRDFDLHGCGFSTICDGEIVAEYYTDRSIIQEIIDECFTEDIHCVAHFGQSDIAAAMQAGYKIPDKFLIDDTILILNLLDENMDDYGLKKVAKKLYNIDMVEYREAAKDGLNTQKFYEYGKLDVMVELKIFCDYYEELEKSPSFQLYREVLCPSIRTFADVMQVGVQWDIDYGRELYLKILPKIEKVEKSIYSAIGKLNIGSTQQLSNRLFRDLGYSPDGLDLTATGKVSLNDKALEKIAKKIPACRDILTWRRLKKVLSTYLTPYMERMSHGGCVSGMYSLHSDTGRTRCSGENIQNVPTEFDSPEMKEIVIRKGFVPRKGKKMLVADFAGIELRGAATICPEPFFQQAFRHYKCRICGAEGESNNILHNCPSCGVFENEKEGFWHGADLHSMTRDEIPALNGSRADAKAVNFAIIYLASGWTLHQQHSHLSADQWQVIIDQYMSRLKGVQAYHKRQEEIYKSGKPSYDIFGRRRFVKLPKKTADAKKYRSEYKRGLNQIVNQPIQGPCSSAFTQIAMNKLRKVWIDKGWWKTKAMILAMIHDEIVSEADEDIIEEARVDLRDAMESCEVFLDVPIRSEARVVSNWYEGK